MANTRVKVRREVLIERLTAERKRVVSEHADAVKTAERERAAFARRLDAMLHDYSAKLNEKPDEALRQVEGYYRRKGDRGTTIKFRTLAPPLEVSDEPNTFKLDRMLAVLQSAEDETLSISAQDEYAKYL